MTPRETFLHACTQIAAQLDGFRLLQKGQVLKKALPDRDTICEIRFQGSRNNGAHNITMLVHLTLSSREFKQWAQSQSLPNGDVSGIFYGNQLGYLTPRKDWRHWQLAGASLPHSVRGIVADLQQYSLPLCDLFTDKAATVAYLRQHGSALTPWLDNKNLHTGLFYYAFCCGGNGYRGNPEKRREIPSSSPMASPHRGTQCVRQSRATENTNKAASMD